MDKTMEYALDGWLPKSGRKLVEGAPSFELCDERSSPAPDNICELWVPVIPLDQDQGRTICHAVGGHMKAK